MKSWRRGASPASIFRPEGTAHGPASGGDDRSPPGVTSARVAGHDGEAMERRLPILATDLDGTLLRSDGTIGPRTREVLHAADVAGLCVVAVTGRPLRMLREVVELRLHGVAICANGAMVVDLATGDVIEQAVIPPVDAIGVAGAFRVLVPGIVFGVEAATWHGREPGFASPRSTAADWRVGSLEELVGGAGVDGVVKMFGRHPDVTVEHLDRYAAAVGARGVVSCSIPTGFVEVAPVGVDKAAALTRVVARLGAGPADVVAIGDMQNDLSMLHWAGRSYAVANAHPDVVAAVDEVVPSNDDEGVALLIERLLSGG